MKGQGFGVKGFVFTGEQVAYCVGDSSLAQNDNGIMKDSGFESLSQHKRFNKTYFIPLPEALEGKRQNNEIIINYFRPFTKKTASKEAVFFIYLTSFLL